MAVDGACSWPPGPRLPSWVQALLLTTAPLRFMERSCRRYGDLVTFRRPFAPPWVVVFHPEPVEQILRAPADRLGKDERRVPSLRGARAPLAPVIGERSIALAEGAEHVRDRRIIRPALHGNSLREYETSVRDAADRMIDSWPVREPFSLLPCTISLTVEISMRAILGIDERQRREELGKQMQALTHPKPTMLGRLARTLSRGRLGNGSARDARRQRRVVDHLICEVIADRRAAPDLEERSDVLSALLTAREEDGRALSEQEVCDHVVSLLIGGRMNPGVGLAWAFERLLRSPATLRRLREELAAGGESYLEAVVKETLRIRSMSLTPVGRIVHDQPFRLGDYLIPPEAHLGVGAAVIHRRVDIHPDPHVFRPERFLGSRRDYIYTWLPFGGGTHRCPGADFAMLEMAVVIRRVLERARLAPLGRRPERSAPMGATLKRVITYVPARGTRVVQLRPPEPVVADANAEVPDVVTDRLSTAH